MKAVLEFTYPEDEHTLKYALRGEEYYLALVEIDTVLANPHRYKDQIDMLNRIKYFLDGVLEE